MAGGAEREDPFLGAGLFLVTARAAEGGIETVLIERLLQSLGLPHVGVERAVIEGVDAALDRFRVAVDQQFHPRLARGFFAQRVHRLELPGGVDMEQREGWRRGVEGLARQMEHHRAVLAHRVEHHRLLGLGDDLAHDVDALGFEPFKMGEDPGHDIPVL